MMINWWSGTKLVFERSLLENLRSKSFKIFTAVLLLLSAAAVVLPRLLTDDSRTYTLATVGAAPPGLVSALGSAGDAGSFDVRYLTRDNPDELRTAVRDGDATVGLTDETIYASTENAGTFPAIVAQAVVSLRTTQRLGELGLTPQQIGELQTIRPPNQVGVGPIQDGARGVIGLGVVIVLQLALLLAGSAIATAVAMEKSTRISEILLAVLRPSQILVGTVLAVGVVTLIELLALGAPLAVAVQVDDKVGLPAVAAADIALGAVWFLLGLAVYAFLYAASGALVEKVTEVGNAVMPISMILFGGYLASFIVTMEDGADSPWSVFLSVFPLTAPVSMPLRWASGTVPVYQLALAMALTAATAVALVSFASRIYRRALTITGHRVGLREVLGRPATA